MNLFDIQLNKQGQLCHLLTVEGLSEPVITGILDLASAFMDSPDKSTVPLDWLRGKTVINLFFETSTRTRTTFEIAAKRLAADVITFNVAASATSKGETLLDTIRNLQAMQADLFIVRHGSSGAAHFIARHVNPPVAVLNAGDGCHAHPTQALLDLYTIRHFKQQFAPLKVAIVGDILHSRVARSHFHALHTLGVQEIRVVAPKTLLPVDIAHFGVKVHYDLASGLDDVDVVMMLRLQDERMKSGLLPSKSEFYHLYGLTAERLSGAKPDVLVMHPGPINRGVEIASEVADGCHSVILKQVNFAAGVRMAVMARLMAAHSPFIQAQIKRVMS